MRAPREKQIGLLDIKPDARLLVQRAQYPNPEQPCLRAPREKQNGLLDIKPDARLLVQGAQTIGGSAVVLDSGVVVIWSFCRSFRANSGFMETDAVCLHLYDPAKRHCSTFYQVSAPRSSFLAAQPLLYRGACF